MNTATIKSHIKSLAKGYRVWTVPLIMVLWDIGFKTYGGNTVADVLQHLVSTPYFLMTGAWAVLLGLAMDRSGRMLLAALQNTEDVESISCVMLEYNRYADLTIITPLIYLLCKGGFLIFTGGTVGGIFTDIHFYICFIATFDGLRAVYGNVLIRKELNY